MKKIPFVLFVIILFFTLYPVDWAQDAHDSQRTGFTHEKPDEPWNFVWSWNGADISGTTNGHFYNASREARTITVGQILYAPAGTEGLYALSLTNGSQLWNNTDDVFNASPAFDYKTGYLFAGGTNGYLYKINTNTGTAVDFYNAGNFITKAILIVKGFAYIVTDSGELHKVNCDTMVNEWTYYAGAIAGTPAAYSYAYDSIIFVTDGDLNVHSVSNTNGILIWKTNPTAVTPGFPNTFNLGWPVVSDRSGTLLLRMKLAMGKIDPFGGVRFPKTNDDIVTWLSNNPGHQNFFALDLATGEKKFIPPVGLGGVEDYDAGPYNEIGSMPIVKTLSDGNDVVYLHFRNGQVMNEGWDFRWDSHIGEMVLNDNTVTGYNAGDIRFTGFEKEDTLAYCRISDEQCPLTGAGNTIFHAHWGGSEAYTITNRNDSLGDFLTNSFSGINHNAVINGMQAAGTMNINTRKATAYMTLCGDSRGYSAGWWTYFGCSATEYAPPGSPSGTAYSGGFQPRYTYVANGYVIVEGNGGDLLVLKHSGVLPQPNEDPGPYRINIGTGHSFSTNPDVSVLAQQAASQAYNTFKSNGGNEADAVLIFQNTGDSQNTIYVDHIYSNFGSNVLIMGASISSSSYTPYTLQDIPELDTEKSVSIMAFEGFGVEFSYAAASGNFSTEDFTNAKEAGFIFASNAAIDLEKKNLILLFGPLHTPLNEWVVMGITNYFGSPIPTNIKILGWSGSYWGCKTYINGNISNDTIAGLIIKGDFDWSLRGIDVGEIGWDGIGGGDPIVEISNFYADIKTEIGNDVDAWFMNIAHPDRNLFDEIRAAIIGEIGSDSRMIGHHSGSETGHDSTSGDLIGDAHHYFMAGIKAAAGLYFPPPNPTPSPVPTPQGDPNQAIQDFGFESGTLDYYQINNAVITNDSYAGDYACELAGDSYVSQEISGYLAADVQYTISAYVKVIINGGSWGSPCLRGSLYDALGTTEYGESSAADNSALGWQYVSYTRTFTAANISNNIYAGIRHFGMPGTSVVDNLSMFAPIVTPTTSPEPTYSPSPTTSPTPTYSPSPTVSPTPEPSNDIGITNILSTTTANTETRAHGPYMIYNDGELTTISMYLQGDSGSGAFIRMGIYSVENETAFAGSRSQQAITSESGI